MDRATLIAAADLLRERNHPAGSTYVYRQVVSQYNALVEGAKSLYPNRADIQAMGTYYQDELVEVETFEHAVLRLKSALEISPSTSASEPSNEPHRIPIGEERSTRQETKPSDPTKVFVVHGRNEKARNALFQFLRTISLKPIEWAEAIRATGNPAPYVGEVLDAAFSMAQAVVVLMTPDDMAYLREPLRGKDEPTHETEATPQARPNVLFEAGMALGRHPLRTVLVELGKVRPFSDVAGRHAVRINNSTQKRQDFAERLAIAGCPVDLTGRDWHTGGDFDAALEGL